MKNKIHFSGLNGLRAIAALAVVFSHTTAGLDKFGLNQFIFGKYPDGHPITTLLGGYGVSIFFSLSGFLITYLLLEEKKAGEINIKNFYIRRILRIWPLYYLYFALAIITAFIFKISYDNKTLLFYIFLLANIPFIFGTSLPMLGHYWSLGVEEQFYSFWPWIVKNTNSLLKITFVICAGLIALKIAVRLIDIRILNGEVSLFYSIIHVARFHCMLIGAIGAILLHQKNTLFQKVTNNLFSQLLCWIIILLVAINQFHLASFIDNELVSVVTVFLIIGQIEKNNRILNLDSPFFNFIGKISYGIYIIHPLITFYLSKIIVCSDKTQVLNYLLVYFSIYTATIFLSYISYHYFEKRFLDMKDKFSSIKSIA